MNKIWSVGLLLDPGRPEDDCSVESGDYRMPSIGVEGLGMAQSTEQ